MRKLLYFLLIFYSFEVYSQTETIPTNEELKQIMYETLNVSSNDRDKINAALAIAKQIEITSHYVKSISDLFKGEVNLPIGLELKNNKKNKKNKVIIEKITYDKNTKKKIISATCIMHLKENNQPILFEGNINIEGENGLGTKGYLELLRPFKMDLGKNVSIIFKKDSKIGFDCKGLSSIFGKMFVVLTSEKIIPVDKNGNKTGDYLYTNAEATFDDFDEFSVSLSFDKSFMIEKVKDIIFTLKGAVLDNNQTYTDNNISFPENYFEGSDSDEYNLWKGIVFKEASVTLPPFFNMQSNNNINKTSRITIGVHNFIVDDQGMSGFVYADNILNSSLLNKDKWDLSIDNFSIKLLKNNIIGLGFKGEMNIPPFGEKSLLPYEANYDAEKENFNFKANIYGKYDLPELYFKMDLYKTSYIDVEIEKNQIYPTINATGTLSIDAPLFDNDNTKRFIIPKIMFENLKISRRSPYFEIGNIGVVGGIETPNFAGFQIQVDKFSSFDNDLGSGLQFEAAISLHNKFKGSGQIQLLGDYSKWKFNKVTMDKARIDYESDAFSISGGIQFKNSDKIYGSGFRGDLNLKIVDLFDIDAVGVFGKKDDYRYFMTDLMYDGGPSKAIGVIGPLSFYALGGGIYNHMQQSNQVLSDNDFGKSLSGMTYLPDNKVGMGFMASTKFATTGLSSLFNGQLTFEMQFNSHGGINFIQFRGDAALLNSTQKLGSLADNINKAVKENEKNYGKLKIRAKSDLKVPDNKKDNMLSASMNMKYDFTNKTFSADMNTFLDAGFIKGVGKDNRMGWASAFFSKDKWYTYIGTPSNRLGINILGLTKSGSYFMVGHDIPELPEPPAKVTRYFSDKNKGYAGRTDLSELSEGTGLAFGNKIYIDLDATLTPFYAHLGVELGAEFVLKNYGQAKCKGSNSIIGINGWYAQGQAWSYVDADIGMKVELFARTRKFKILNIGAGALLRGAGPNPIYFNGQVGGRFSVLGGLVSGKCDFDFQIGKECEIVGGSPFGESVIADITPSDNEKDVNVFSAPQVVLNIPIDTEMKIEEDGEEVYYKVNLEEFYVKYKNNNQTINGTKQLEEENRLYTFDPTEPFLSHEKMKVYAKVSFQKKQGNKWISVKDENGKVLYEEKEAEFTSGERPKYIMPEHIKYSYPILNQYNYYPEEYNKGYIILSKNYSYLFGSNVPKGFQQKLKLEAKNGGVQYADFTTSTSSGYPFQINFNMSNFKLENNKIYNLAIVNIPLKEASNTDNISTENEALNGNESITVSRKKSEATLAKLDTNIIYECNFRTSNYNTFVDKMNSFSKGEVNSLFMGSYNQTMTTNIIENNSEAEAFDMFEISNKMDKNLLRFKIDYDNTDWYNEKIAPIIYDNKSLLSAIKIFNLSPPNKEDIVSINMTYPPSYLTKDMIQGVKNNFMPIGMITNHMADAIYRDFNSLQNKLANTTLSSKKLNKKELEEILGKSYIPSYTKGDYPIIISYVLPGKDIITSSFTFISKYK